MPPLSPKTTPRRKKTSKAVDPQPDPGLDPEPDANSLSHWGRESREDRTAYYADGERYTHTPGDILLSCRPFVHIVSDLYVGKICDLCLQSPEDGNLRMCRECEQIFFCETCITSTNSSVFKSLHMLECRLFAKYKEKLSLPVRLFLRLFLRLTEESTELIPEQKFAEIDGVIPTFEGLAISNELDTITVDNFDERFKEIGEIIKDDIPDDWMDSIPVDELALVQFGILYGYLNDIDELSKIVLEKNSAWSLFNLFTRLWCNAMPILDESITGLFHNHAVGIALYLEPCFAIWSHSCDANYAYAHYGTLLQIRATRFVETTDKRTVEMIDCTLPRSIRIKNMRTHFIDSCCDRCQTLPDDFMKTQLELIELYHEIFPRLSAAHKVSGRFNHDDMTPEKLQETLGKVNRLFKVCIEMKNAYKNITTDVHPVLSRIYFAAIAATFNQFLLKLELGEYQENSAELKSEADLWLQLLKAARFNIASTHGVDHQLYRRMPVPLCDVFRSCYDERTITLDRLCEENADVIEDVLRVARTKLVSWAIIGRTRKWFFGSEDGYNLVSIFNLILVLFAIFFGFYTYGTVRDEGGHVSDFL